MVKRHNVRGYQESVHFPSLTHKYVYGSHYTAEALLKVTIISNDLNKLSFFFFLFLVWLRRNVCLFHLHERVCYPLIPYLISGLFRFTNAGLSISIYIYISPLVIYIHTWLLFKRYELLPIGILILSICQILYLNCIIFAFHIFYCICIHFCSNVRDRELNIYSKTYIQSFQLV